MYERIRELMQHLEVPDEFMNDDGMRNLLLMLYPTYCMKHLGPDLGITGTMAQVAQIRNSFFEIFKEHNAKMREMFFA